MRASGINESLRCSEVLREGTVVLTFVFLTFLAATSWGCETGEPPNWEFTPTVKSASFVGTDGACFITLKGNVLFTESGGANWHIAKNTPSFEQVSLIDATLGFGIAKDGKVWKTSNGGASWREVSKVEYSDLGLAGIRFIDDLHGWVFGPFSLWSTDDGGITWRQKTAIDNPHGIRNSMHGFAFVNPEIGWLCGTEGSVFHTRDGGNTWDAQQLIADGSDMSAISFIDERTGWCSSRPKSVIYRTDDGGKTWEPHTMPTTGVDIQSICFVTKNEGWAVGTDREVLHPRDRIWGVVLHTADGGQTWRFVETGTNELFYHRVYFSDAQHGWLLARDSTYRTEDGGTTWTKVLTLPDGQR